MSAMSDTLENRDYNGNVIKITAKKEVIRPRREVDNGRTLAKLEQIRESSTEWN